MRKESEMAGVRVSKNDLAHIFGVEPPVIDMWLHKGLPYVRKPRVRNGQPPDDREWVFDTAEAIEWRVSLARQSDMSGA